VVGATGIVSGAANTGKGRANSILRYVGGKPMFNVDTSSAVFDNTINMVRSASRTLVEEGGRMSDEDRRVLNQIITGTGWFDTPESFEAAMKNVKSVMERQKATYLKESGRKPEEKRVIKFTPEMLQ